MTIAELKTLLLSDPDLSRVLTICRDLGLPDCWLAAGAVRNTIWNHLNGRPLFDSETDLDVIFYDPTVTAEQVARLETDLRQAHPAYAWELKNQVDMHHHSPHTLPYSSSCDAVSKYPETCTAIAVRLTAEGELDIFAPYGLADILAFRVRPTPHFLADPDRLSLYCQRLSKKKWTNKWPNLYLLYS